MEPEPSYVSSFLVENGLQAYVNIFASQGQRYCIDLCALDAEDLEHNLNIANAEDRAKILQCVNTLPISDWLAFFKLEQFEGVFQRNGINTVADVKSFQWNKKNLDGFHAIPQADQRRLLLAVGCITKDVAVKGAHLFEGRWARPNMDYYRNLGVTRKYILIDGCLKSHNAIQSQTIEFLVDSGSNIVSVSAEIIEALQLEVIRHDMAFVGVHRTVHGTLYFAKLVLGDSEIDVEVLADPLASIGVTVLEKFDHVIVGDRHMWYSKAGPLQVQQA